MAPARFIGYEEHARGRAAQAERDLALAEDRHQRAADSAHAQYRERDDNELQRIRQLIGYRLAGMHAETEQERRRALHAVAEFLPRQRRIAAVARLDDGEVERHLSRVPSQKLVERELRGLIGLEHRPVGLGREAPAVCGRF